jgi:hypothetical protein
MFYKLNTDRYWVRRETVGIKCQVDIYDKNFKILLKKEIDDLKANVSEHSKGKYISISTGYQFVLYDEKYQLLIEKQKKVKYTGTQGFYFKDIIKDKLVFIESEGNKDILNIYNIKNKNEIKIQLGTNPYVFVFNNKIAEISHLSNNTPKVSFYDLFGNKEKDEIFLEEKDNIEGVIVLKNKIMFFVKNKDNYKIYVTK